MLSSYLLSDDSILIDFSDCEYIDIPNAMFLDIIIKELNFIKYSYNLKFYNCVKKVIRYKESKYTKTNKCLYVFKLIKEVKEANKGEGFLYLGLKKDGQKEHPIRKIIKELYAKKLEDS